MIEQTLERLTALRLSVMAEVLREMERAPPAQELSWQERISLLVDREWQTRENKKLSRRIKDAQIKKRASVEELKIDPARGVDKPLVRELSLCRWIDAKHNLIFLGATGTGKSYFAAALAEQACRKGYRALFLRMPRLFEELSIARTQGTYGTALARFAKFDVVVLDDFLMAPLSDTERRDLLELLEDRHEHSSTIFTSQAPPKTWHSAIGDPTIADAICDRILHNAKTVALKGHSLRKTAIPST